MSYKGKWMPKNIGKYKGDPRKITYRSNWEKFMFGWMDNNPDIVKWGSETAIIPYFSEADGKRRKYYMDIWCKYENGQEFFFEIKPEKETKPPIPPVRATAAAKKRYINEVYTWSVNQSKWRAAKELSEKMGITFRLITEPALKKLGYTGIR